MTRYISFLSILLFFCSCGSGDIVEKGDVLVKVGSSVLTKSEMSRHMPYGLSDADSVKFTRAYIRSWIDAKLVSELAVKNIDTSDAIDQMVNDYRNELIMREYRKRMYETHVDESLIADSLLAYYNANKDDFLLERPIIKGIYIRIADSAPRIDDVKKWYRSQRNEDIESLEKYGLTGAIHYDYFRDRWVDWMQIESRIPYDFGTNIVGFIKNNRNFEVSIDGSTYLLDITDYQPSGTVMPYEFAKEQIMELFINRSRIDYDLNLRRSLFQEGIENGDVEVFVDLES